MGIICEKHNPCEQDRGDRTVEFENKRWILKNNSDTTGRLNVPNRVQKTQKNLYQNLYLRYYISKAQFINANDAKIACQAKGKHWDLAIIEDKQEHSFLNKKIGGCVPYWVGMTNPTGTELKDRQGNDVTFANWDTHLGKALEIEFLIYVTATMMLVTKIFELSTTHFAVTNINLTLTNLW